MAANRLLIIDDEPRIGKLLSMVARSRGYDAIATSDASEFRKLHGEWQPTHIALDLHMPGTDGIEILRFLASEKSRAQVLVVSGFDARVLETARRLGVERGLAMAGTLLKPMRVAELEQVLDQLKLSDDAITGGDLMQAIENGEIVLFFQPKIRLDRMEAVRFEALARWRRPGRGLVMPDEFVPAAERAGVIGALTREVASQAVRQLRSWRGSGHAFAVAINISGRDLSDVALADGLGRLCEQHAVTPDWITLELTETAAAANAADATDILTRLRLKGFRLSIDDFGTGHSSMIQLHRQPFSEIKIDKEFVMGFAAANGNRVIVKTIIDLGHNLGMEVVAEGVESEGMADELRRLGCEYAQGYYFSPPLEADQVAAWAADWAKRNPAG